MFSCFHRSQLRRGGFPFYFSLKVQNVRHTNDPKCRLPTRKEEGSWKGKRGKRREEGKVRRKVSLGERAGKKELEPAERKGGREGAALLSAPLLLALTLFAKVQSSGMDRKVKINRRRPRRPPRSEFFTTFPSSSSTEGALRVSFRRRRHYRRRTPKVSDAVRSWSY